jgi:hypothetical protein
MKKKRGNINRNTIKKDLINQLTKNGNTSRYYLDLVDDYMNLWDTKNALFEDIENRGVVVAYNNGGGQSGMKQNDSVPAVLKVNGQMTKILDSLGIKPSLVMVDDDEDDDIDL